MSKRTKGELKVFRGKLLDKTGYIIAGSSRRYPQEDADLNHITALWNASKGKSTEEAVKVLKLLSEYGGIVFKIPTILKQYKEMKQMLIEVANADDSVMIHKVKELLTKLEDK